MGKQKGIRSLQNIRTMAGKCSRASEPFKIYMRISCLDMERLRKETERKSAMNRVDNIDARLKEIKDEKDKLLQELMEHDPEYLSNMQTVEVKRELKRQSLSCRNKGGFKIKY